MTIIKLLFLSYMPTILYFSFYHVISINMYTLARAYIQEKI